MVYESRLELTVCYSRTSIRRCGASWHSRSCYRRRSQVRCAGTYLLFLADRARPRGGRRQAPAPHYEGGRGARPWVEPGPRWSYAAGGTRCGASHRGWSWRTCGSWRGTAGTGCSTLACSTRSGTRIWTACRWAQSWKACPAGRRRWSGPGCCTCCGDRSSSLTCAGRCRRHTCSGGRHERRRPSTQILLRLRGKPPRVLHHNIHRRNPIRASVPCGSITVFGLVGICGAASRSRYPEFVWCPQSRVCQLHEDAEVAAELGFVDGGVLCGEALSDGDGFGDRGEGVVALA